MSVKTPAPLIGCLNCNKLPQRRTYKYCSNKCQADHRYLQYIHQWKSGDIVGLQRLGVVSRHIKRYLREKYDNKCCLCGWAEENVKTGLIPLVADHIDGDWRNNTEDNLRLVCPNCDSISPTYAALNMGRGRKERRLSNRVKQARIMIEKLPE